MKPNILLKNRKGNFVNFLGIKIPAPNSRCNETTWNLPEYFGKGLFRKIELSPEMSITISDCKLKTNYSVKVEHSEPLITFVFPIAGRTKSRNSFFEKGFDMESGNTYLHYFPDPILLREVCAMEQLRAVVIKMTPRRFNILTEGEFDRIPANLEIAVKGDGDKPYYSSHVITPLMRMSLRQILNCPYRGLTRRLYLESKAMELIAYKMEQLLDEKNGSLMNNVLCVEDIERVRQARDMLISDMQNPPSLSGLAKSVGTTHTRLNRIFRQIYGSTAFDYLRRQRLEYSRLLLIEEEMNITEVAFAAGFSSSSHFAHAFLKYFGVQPNLYRKAISKNPRYFLPCSS